MNRWVEANYRRSLKLWMGYVEETQWASLLDVGAVMALSWLVMPDSPHLEEFLTRYRKDQRERRRQQVRYVVLVWLAEFAL